VSKVYLAMDAKTRRTEGGRPEPPIRPTGRSQGTASSDSAALDRAAARHGRCCLTLLIRPERRTEIMVRDLRTFDAIVVGGGPAGLLGALYLARFRREVLLLDGLESRAQRIPRSHNYPGFSDGIGGPDLLQSLRKQVAHYPIDARSLRAESISKLPSGFRIHWANGAADARFVLIATGASDIEPDMPHVAEALRDGALRYCPVCDGYEAIDKAIGVLVAGPAGVREADAHQQTSVPGLYAAGDVASGLNQISVAFGNAAIAASAMHRAMLG